MYLTLNKSNAVFYLKHGGAVLYVLRSGSPMNICRVLIWDHLRHLLDQRKDWVSDNVCIEGELLKTESVLVSERSHAL